MCDADFAGWVTKTNLPIGDLRALPAGRDDSINPQFFRLHNLFGRVTYKPGTRIVVEAERTRACVNIWIPTVDANDQEKYYEGRFYMWAPYWIIEQQTDTELLNWLIRNVAAFETHEVMEFFMVGGKQFRSPHPWEDPMHGDYMKDCAKVVELLPKETPLEV